MWRYARKKFFFLQNQQRATTNKHVDTEANITKIPLTETNKQKKEICIFFIVLYIFYTVSFGVLSYDIVMCARMEISARPGVHRVTCSTQKIQSYKSIQYPPCTSERAARRKRVWRSPMLQTIRRSQRCDDQPFLQESRSQSTL